MRRARGNDRICGGLGIDDLYRDAGDDVIHTGFNADGDTAHDGTSNDQFDAERASTPGRVVDDSIACSSDTHVLGDAGRDTCHADGDDFLKSCEVRP